MALALPDAVKIRHGFGKWIVREGVEGVVPDAIRLARYKRGFNVEQAAWIDAGLGRRVRQALLGRERPIRGAHRGDVLRRRPEAAPDSLRGGDHAPLAGGRRRSRRAARGRGASAGGVLPGRVAAARDGGIGTTP